MTRIPKQDRARFTYEAIVEASARVLSENGWEKFSTNEIARVAGVSIGTLYEYFAHKEAILEVLLDRHVSAGEALIGEKLRHFSGPHDGSLRELMSLLVDGYISLHEHDPALHRRLSAEVPIPEAIMVRVAQMQNLLVETITSLLAVHPEASVESHELSARLVIETVDSLTHRWIIDSAGEPMSSKELRDALVSMLTKHVTRR